MAKQLGRELFIEKETASAVWTKICGFRARSFTINNEMIDMTTPTCAAPGGKVHEELMYGTQSMSFEGSGLFEDDAAMIQVEADAHSQAMDNYRVSIPGLGVWTQIMAIENFSFNGDTNEGLGFSCTWRRSGSSTFVAA